MKTVRMKVLRLLAGKLVVPGQEVKVHPDNAQVLIRTGQAELPDADDNDDVDEEPSGPPPLKAADAARARRRAVRFGEA
jgi:hypothetical protein